MTQPISPSLEQYPLAPPPSSISEGPVSSESILDSTNVNPGLDSIELIAVHSGITPPPSPLGNWRPEVKACLVEDACTVPILNLSLAKREVAKMRLPNGLEAIVVSDPDSEQSGAALSVGIGSFSDPANAPGIAHFTEHLLFMGTEKYPQENAYSEHIAKYSGMSNAFTADELTGYMFSCGHKGFSKALDLFACFFKCPLFDPSGVKRELQAVDSEFIKAKDSDYWRTQHVKQLLENPLHPCSQFSMGNSESLGKYSAEQVKTWWESNYCAGLMHVKAHGDKPLSELCGEIYDAFKDIPNKGLCAFDTNELRLSPTEKNKVLCIEPHADIRTLTLEWELPREYVNQFQTKPAALVSHILGDEGTSSLLEQLKKEGFANSLGAGGRDQGPSNHVFNIQIGLTELGQSNLEPVITLCYQAIEDLRQRGISTELFESIKELRKGSYQNQERGKLFYELMHDASQMPSVPLASYPEAHSLLYENDSSLLSGYLNHLRPANCLYTFRTKSKEQGPELDQTEPWMQSLYTIERLDPEYIQRWNQVQPHPAISVASPNPFIHRDDTLVHMQSVERGIIKATCIESCDKGRLFMAPDLRFATPRDAYIFDIKTPSLVPGNTRSQILGSMYCLYLQHHLNATLYKGAEAEIESRLTCIDDKIRISVEGYSDTSPLMLTAFQEALTQPLEREELFNLCKDQLLRGCRNFYKKNPYQAAQELTKCVRSPDGRTAKSLGDALEQITFTDLQDFAQQLFDRSYIEGTVFGNLNAQEARGRWRELIQQLDSANYPRSEHWVARTAAFPKPGMMCIQDTTTSEDNVAALTLHQGEVTLSTLATHTILSKMLREPFFDELRTKQQTGYIVSSGGMEMTGQLYSTFLVQSPKFHTHYLLEEYEKFIVDFCQKLSGKREDFEALKQSLLENMRYGPKSTGDMASALHRIVTHYKEDFGRSERLCEAIEALDFVQFCIDVRKMLSKEHNGRLAVLITGKGHAEQSAPERLEFCDPIQVQELASICEAVSFQSNKA